MNFLCSGHVKFQFKDSSISIQRALQTVVNILPHLIQEIYRNLPEIIFLREKAEWNLLDRFKHNAFLPYIFL